MEGTLRAKLAETGQTLPDMNDRPTAPPSADAAMRLFALVQGVHVHIDGRLVARQVHRLSVDAEGVSMQLEFQPSIYWAPRRRLPKWRDATEPQRRHRTSATVLGTRPG